MYFALRTTNGRLKKQAKEIIENIRKTLGNDKVKNVREYDTFVAIDLDNVSGLIGCHYSMERKPQLLIHSIGDVEKSVKINMVNIDTIFDLG